MVEDLNSNCLEEKTGYITDRVFRKMESCRKQLGNALHDFDTIKETLITQNQNYDKCVGQNA